MGRLLHSHVVKLIESKNIMDFCTALIKCRDILDSRLWNKNYFIEYLKSKLCEEVVCLEKNSILGALPNRFNNVVQLYKDVEACLVYGAFKISYCTSVKELTSQLDEIVSLFMYRTTEPKTDILDEAEIASLLELVQNKYGFLDAVTYEKRLEIYLINRSHLYFDSWLMTFKNTYTGKWVNKWMVMSFSPCMDTLLCNKYFVFLHEMGHILYSEITDGGASVPELFRELAMLMGIPVSTGDDKLAELFSDIFAAATLDGSQYAVYNPYSVFLPKELLKLLEEYFSMIVSRVSGGYYNIVEKRNLH